MVNAEKINSKGQYWIKIWYTKNHLIDSKMVTIPTHVYSAFHKAWAIKYEYRTIFEKLMREHIIIWHGEEGEKTAGGIPESHFSDMPIDPSRTVSYDKDGITTGGTGWKTLPIAKYQVVGHNAICQEDFLILADDAGLGKSFMTATGIESKIRLGKCKRGIILCKGTLLYNWRDEIHKHTHLKSVVVAGTKQKRFKLYAELETDDSWSFMIVTYDTFKNDLAIIYNLQKAIGLDFLVCDEAHKIKNPLCETGNSVHRIEFKYKYLLTATPLVNSPLDAYNYLKLGDKITDGFWDFKHKYAEWGTHNTFNGATYPFVKIYKNIDELRDIIHGCMLRRLKVDKLKQLPDITIQNIKVEMTRKQAKVYEVVKKAVIAELKAETGLTKIRGAMAKIGRLQQVTNSPALVGGVNDSAKLNEIDSLLESLIDEGNNKVILFTKYEEFAVILKERYAKYNPAYIAGNVKTSGMSERTAKGKIERGESTQTIEELTTGDRQKEVYKFQGDHTCKLFIGTSGACKEGLTLTASSYVIFADMEWNWSSYEQAWSRAHRIGQKDAVTVYNILCEGTIDEHVYNTVMNKKSIIDYTLDNVVHTTESTTNTRQFINLALGEKIA